MSRMSRDKGIKAERDVVNWLRRNGFPHAERRGSGFGPTPAAGADIIGIPAVTIDVKDRARLELAAYIDQLEDELDIDGNDIGAVIHKRRGRANPADWYATCPAYIFVRLLLEAGYGSFQDVD